MPWEAGVNRNEHTVSQVNAFFSTLTSSAGLLFTHLLDVRFPARRRVVGLHGEIDKASETHGHESKRPIYTRRTIDSTHTTNTTRLPSERIRSIISCAPGIAASPRHNTTRACSNTHSIHIVGSSSRSALLPTSTAHARTHRHRSRGGRRRCHRSTAATRGSRASAGSLSPQLSPLCSYLFCLSSAVRRRLLLGVCVADCRMTQCSLGAQHYTG